MSKNTTHYFVQSVPNYKELLFYRKSVALYDVTFDFCERFLTKGDRTIDQMVQAARSGKQNIIEGSEAAATSSETEIKLLNVARKPQRATSGFRRLSAGKKKGSMERETPKVRSASQVLPRDE